MSQPESSGDILRAIAGAYRGELGPAKAEQLVNRAMARASTSPARSPAQRIAAPALAVGVFFLVMGIVGLVDDSPVTDPDPAVPLASAPSPQESTPEQTSSPVVSIPTQELEQALDLIDQQKELEAAEVVVRALSAVVTPETVSEEGTSSQPVTSDVATPETPPAASTGNGGVPPEANTYQPGGDLPESVAENTGTGAPEAEESSGASDSQPVTSQPQPTIEELGQALKVEVEELLSADPQDLASAAQEARDAATPILEYGQEPSILLPPDE